MNGRMPIISDDAFATVRGYDDVLPGMVRLRPGDVIVRYDHQRWSVETVNDCCAKVVPLFKEKRIIRDKLWETEREIEVTGRSVSIAVSVPEEILVERGNLRKEFTKRVGPPPRKSLTDHQQKTTSPASPEATQKDDSMKKDTKTVKPIAGRAEYIQKLKADKVDRDEALAKTQARFNCGPKDFMKIWTDNPDWNGKSPKSSLRGENAPAKKAGPPARKATASKKTPPPVRAKTAPAKRPSAPPPRAPQPAAATTPAPASPIPPAPASAEATAQS